MRHLDLGMVVRYEGKLAEVYAIGEGRTISLRFLGEDPCRTCGRSAGVSLLEHAPLLQEQARACRDGDRMTAQSHRRHSSMYAFVQRSTR